MGNWTPTPAEKERQEKELAQAQAKRLAELLRQVGIDPDQIYSKLKSAVPQMEMIKTSARVNFAIYFCGGFDLKLL